MIKRFKNLFAVFIVYTLTLPTASLAQDLYISDQLLVPVRKGQGNQFAILHKGLPSGTKVTLVERDTNWSLIQTAGGITGWVRNQYLLENPTANVSIVRVRENLASTQAENEQILAENARLTQALEDTQAELNLVQQASTNTSSELAELKEISASAVQSYEQVQTLAKEIQLLQTENDVLIAEKERLERSERTTFFFYGALAVFLGVLIAVIVPKLRTNKRNNGWIN